MSSVNGLRTEVCPIGIFNGNLSGSSSSLNESRFSSPLVLEESDDDDVARIDEVCDGVGVLEDLRRRPDLLLDPRDDLVGHPAAAVPKVHSHFSTHSKILCRLLERRFFCRVSSTQITCMYQSHLSKQVLPDVLSLAVVEQRRVAADLHLLDEATLHGSVNFAQLDLGVFLQK